MKVINVDRAKEIKLPAIHISAEDLVLLLEKSTSKNDKIELTIGETFDSSYTVLESIAEIRQHQSSISVPFSMKTQGVTLFFRSYGVTITYEAETQALAKTLARRLREFKPWYLFAFRPWFAGASLIPLWIFIFSGLIEKLDTLMSAAVILILLLPTLFSFSSFQLDKPRLIQRERQGFWRRNRDAIAMLFIGVIMTMLGTKIVDQFPTKTSTDPQNSTSSVDVDHQ